MLLASTPDPNRTAHPPMAERAGWRGQVALAGYRLGWWLARRLPERMVRAAFDRIADVATRRDGKGVRRLRSNLSRVVPTASPAELATLTRAAMRSYLRYFCEAFRLPTLSTADINARVETIDEHHFRAALATGRGVVVALPHLANWDLAGAWAAVNTDVGVLSVAERLEPAELFDRFVAYRNAIGIDIVALTGEDPFPHLVERVRSGRLVCLVADRDLSERGIGVDFFGATAKMPAGPAAIALRTGAVLMAVTLHYKSTGVGAPLVVTFSEPIPVTREAGTLATAAATQRVADWFAAGIAAHPQDWHMLQRIWPDAQDAGSTEGPA
jgi:lauroyl/myristoyl acyltransferase